MSKVENRKLLKHTASLCEHDNGWKEGNVQASVVPAG